ncbi:MAG TPA: hypothetical protein VFC03_10520 [Acidimicrobiales bacterium]|nr:hypothetical protein [Acidimicrobiales bacterium]
MPSDREATIALARDAFSQGDRIGRDAFDIAFTTSASSASTLMPRWNPKSCDLGSATRHAPR